MTLENSLQAVDSDPAPEIAVATALNRDPNLQPRIAVLIPCYNEELTVADVVRQFRTHLPGASMSVFDNTSSDNTVGLAQKAGAAVYSEQRQGKGYVTQSMFRQVDADVYIMVDGDGTYPPGSVHRLLAPVLKGQADMVVGSRLHAESKSEFKQLNAMGKHL